MENFIDAALSGWYFFKNKFLIGINVTSVSPGTVEFPNPWREQPSFGRRGTRRDDIRQEVAAATSVAAHTNDIGDQPVLQIKQSQVEVLGLASYRGFRARALAHVRKYFPNHALVAGDAVLEATVDYNLARGTEHGMRTERTALLYLTTAMMLGSGFDQSPAFPWAAEILASDRRPVDRARDLAHAALAHQERIAGQGNRAMNRAFLSLARVFGALSGPDVAPGFGMGTSAGLADLHPERAEAFGEEVMTFLDNEAVARAEAYGFAGPNGPALIGVSMFFIGWNPKEEPFTPWARETLTGPRYADGVARQAAFHSAAADFLHRWLQHPGRGDS
ncbi:MAG: hypothetical protein GY850_23815 [bacterium]|nr:hypothetical protein [bacterium]